MNKKDPRSAVANRGSECPRDKGSGLRRCQSHRGLEYRIAGEDAIAAKPLVRVRDPEGADRPAVAGETAGAHDATIHIEDVRVAVYEELALMAIRLRLNLLEEPGEEGLVVLAEFGLDGAVDGDLREPATRERRGRDVLLDLAPEPLREVVADVVDPSVSLLEVVRDDEPLTHRDGDVRLHEFKDRLHDDLDCAGKKALDAFHPAELVDDRFYLPESEFVVLHHSLLPANSQNHPSTRGYRDLKRNATGFTVCLEYSTFYQFCQVIERNCYFMALYQQSLI